MPAREIDMKSPIIARAKKPKRSARKRPPQPELQTRIVTAKNPAKENKWRRYLAGTKQDDTTA
jgi:hypothetical protein